MFKFISFRLFLEMGVIIDVLKTCRLSKCFEILAQMKVSDLTAEEKAELEIILKDIMLRTHSFAGLMTADDFYKGKTMKNDFDTFKENVKKSGSSINVPFDEFENAWKTLEMFDPYSKNPTLEKRRENKVSDQKRSTLIQSAIF